MNIAVTLLAAQRAVLHENELTVCMWEIERAVYHLMSSGSALK